MAELPSFFLNIHRNASFKERKNAVNHDNKRKPYPSIGISQLVLILVEFS